MRTKLELLEELQLATELYHPMRQNPAIRARYVLVPVAVRDELMGILEGSEPPRASRKRGRAA